MSTAKLSVATAPVTHKLYLGLLYIRQENVIGAKVGVMGIIAVGVQGLCRTGCIVLNLSFGNSS